MCSTKAPNTRRSSAEMTKSLSTTRRVEMMCCAWIDERGDGNRASAHRIEQFVDAGLGGVLHVLQGLLAGQHVADLLVYRDLYRPLARNGQRYAAAAGRYFGDVAAHRQGCEPRAGQCQLADRQVAGARPFHVVVPDEL